MSAKEQPAEAATTSARGLKGGALGFVASTGMGIASTAPAYSLAATLGFVVATVGPQTLLLVPLAFIPMFFSAWANKEMNRADPDCGSSFTWAARALGPKTGWYAGGWGTIASDLLAMASQSQIAGPVLLPAHRGQVDRRQRDQPVGADRRHRLDRHPHLHLLPRHPGLRATPGHPAGGRDLHAAAARRRGHRPGRPRQRAGRARRLLLVLAQPGPLRLAERVHGRACC